MTKKIPKPVVDTGKPPRRITPGSYLSRRRRLKAQRTLARTKLPNSFNILGQGLVLLGRHWEVFGGLWLIYALINAVLVGGLAADGTLNQVKDSLTDIFTGQFSQLNTGLSLYTYLLQSGAGVAGGVGSAYQSVLLIIFSLMFVWALRKLHAGSSVRVRDALYNATAPLVPLVLVLMTMALHLVPFIAGAFLFNSLVLGSVLTVGWQQVLAIVICVLLVVWSLYLLCASVFAAYIVTLPDMTPLKALRAAKDIVRHRRGMVLRKVLFLPVTLLVAVGLIMVPVALFATVLATPVYFILTLLVLPVALAYMYILYRELIAA